MNQKYYQRAVSEVKQIKGITGDLQCCLGYDVYANKISLQDGIDTIKAIKKILLKPDFCLDDELALYEELLKEQSNQEH